MASLSTECNNILDQSCINDNYLASNEYVTWTLNSLENNTYQVFYVYSSVAFSNASSIKKVHPVIYLNKNVITGEGKGTKSKPYIIK